MKKNYLFSVFVLFLFSFQQLLADSAPSMNMYTYSANSDAILKMNKVKIVKSADASFFQTVGFTNGYCGLQQSSASPYKIFIFSLWDYSTANGIHARADYFNHPTTQSSRFGGEGDGAKTMANYQWKLNTYYNIVIRAWKSGGRIYQASFIQDTSNSKWFHTATLSNVQRNNWLGGSANSFIENWTSNGQYARKAFYKDYYSLSPSGNWSKSTGCSVSANGSQADINRNGIYHNSFNAFYDEEEDAFCMEHGKGVEPGSIFKGGRSANLGLQKKQADMPTLTVGELLNLNAVYNEGITTVSWEINELKSPQLTTHIEIKNKNGNLVYERKDTLPEIRKVEIDELFEAGEYDVSITMTDIFNQNDETKTVSLTVDAAKYLRTSTNKIQVPVVATQYKGFDIASNSNWNISSDKEWLKFSKNSGFGNASIRIITTDNPDTTKTRTAQISIYAEGAETQNIELIQNKNETWYILFNQRGWSSGKPIMNNALTGTELGEELTAFPPNQDNYLQHWKVEYSEDGKHMQLINRVTGLSINSECKANDPDENYLWKLQKPTGSKQFPGYRIISKDGKIGIHAQGSRVFNYNYEVSECFWFFAKPEEIYNYPTQPIEYSAGDKEIWYNIYTPGRSDRNYLTDNGLNETLTGSNLDENNQAQMWKIIDYGEGNVQLVSKKNNGQIQTPPNARTGIKLGEQEQTWKLIYREDEQYNIENGEFHLNLATSRSVAGVRSSKIGDSGCWIFEKAANLNTSVGSLNPNQIHIFSKDSKIIVLGSNLTPEIYTVSGQQVNIKQELNKGIYIVRVGSIARKVIVE